MVVASVGMYRSASTLSYNIAKTIVEKGGFGYSSAYPSIGDIYKKEIIVCKCHDLDEKWDISKNEYWRSFYCIYTYRDIRSVMASFCMWRKMTLDTFNFQGKDANSMIDWLLEMDEKWRSVEKVLLLKYRDHFPYQKRQVVKLARKIAAFLNLEPSIETYTEIAINFNFDAMKKKADALSEGDKETLLNPNHLSDGEIHKWKKLFNKEEQDRFFNSNGKLMFWLGKNEFDLD